MSSPDRRKCEYRSAEHEGIPVSSRPGVLAIPKAGTLQHL